MIDTCQSHLQAQGHALPPPPQKKYSSNPFHAHAPHARGIPKCDQKFFFEKLKKNFSRCMFNPKSDLKDTEVISDLAMESLKRLTSKLLKAIAREHGIRGWAKMSKPKLLEALQPIEIILDNLRVTELRSLAKLRGVEGYKTMR